MKIKISLIMIMGLLVSLTQCSGPTQSEIDTMFKYDQNKLRIAHAPDTFFYLVNLAIQKSNPAFLEKVFDHNQIDKSFRLSIKIFNENFMEMPRNFIH
jgi:hypothetical protein